MTSCSKYIVIVSGFLFVAGCETGPRVYTTRGSATVECDESVFPVIRLEADEFERTYKEATITLRSVEAREAIVNFLNDSVKVIVSARPLNREEREFAKHAQIEYQEFEVALSAVAVIGHKDNPTTELRTGDLDSMFSGLTTRWPGQLGNIDLVVGGPNSSTNEVFRMLVLKGRPFAHSATPMNSSKDLVEYVRMHPRALGIVGVSWLHGRDEELTVFALGDPSSRPDTTQPLGRFYTPHQAHIHRRYYPVTESIYMYNRAIQRDAGYGFISFVASAPGQKIFLNNGLVPVTMPVRLVSLTSIAR